MSNIKCPFCRQELDYFAEDIYYCPNHQKYMGSEELWQELIRTRKALDVAVNALKDNLSLANFWQMLDASRFHCIRTRCELALEQITALKQKDVK